MEIIAKSVSIRVIGEVQRCSEGESSKFYCLPVKILFDNGEEKDHLLKAHGEPKTLLDFLENKKGLKDRMEKSFVLLKNGEVLHGIYLSQ